MGSFGALASAQICCSISNKEAIYDKTGNHLGTIEISQEYFANLVGHAASECFGVSGMVFKRPHPGDPFRPQPWDVADKGVKVKPSEAACPLSFTL